MQIYVILLSLILFSQKGEAALILDGLIRTYSKIDTLQGEFIQKTYFADFDTEKEFHGVLYFKRPDKMLWRYSGNSSDIVYINNKEIILYQPENKQAFYTTVEKTGLTSSPLILLFNINKLKDDFNVTEDMNKECIILSPKKPSLLKSVTLYVENKTHLIKRFIITDRSGNKSDIEINYTGINRPVKKEIFKFIPPEGTTIIQQ